MVIAFFKTTSCAIFMNFIDCIYKFFYNHSQHTRIY